MTISLKSCPFLPICVCSRSDALPRHRIEPLAISKDPVTTFERLKTLLAETKRIQLVDETDTSIHAVCRTLLGFIDDLEFHLSIPEQVIHVRSKSRIALYDFGVNRRRVEALRRRLQQGSD